MLKNVSQSKDTKKWPTDADFQAPESTGCKVKMAGANAGLSVCLSAENLTCEINIFL